jgi:L-asparagine oxygenase
VTVRIEHESKSTWPLIFVERLSGVVPLWRSSLPQGEFTVSVKASADDVRVIDLGDRAQELGRAVEAVVGPFGSVENKDFLDRLPLLRGVLPEDVQLGLRAAMLDEQAAAVVVRGFPVPASVGATPLHWRDGDPAVTRTADAYLMLLGSAVGEPFAWETLQGGRLVNSILPIPGTELEQTGHSSAALLDFHCEDAFHDLRCDYLGLLSLRNEQRVATTVATVDPGELDPADIAVLRQPRFRIRADDEHRRNGADLATGESATAWLAESVVPVLSGGAQAPYLRLDPPYMASVEGDEEAVGALRRLIDRLGESLVDVVLEPGDALFIDNYRAVHGRRAFEARYDGTDRWLRRVMLTRDLRKSRALREGACGRIIH